VNGIHVAGICTDSIELMSEAIRNLPVITNSYEELLDAVEAVYIRSQPAEHYHQIRQALERGKHVICESPLVLNREECEELQQLAKDKNLILMEAIKTAYATAYSRLLLLIKSGSIGRVVSVDATCTSIREIDVDDPLDVKRIWDGIHEWGPTGLLPVFQILGTEYQDKRVVVRYRDPEQKHDSFVKTDFIYADAVASVKTGNGVKSEGELVISGTKGYVYVPAPWWKTDYFEVRYENPAENRRCFYQLDGEGIRYELVAFAGAVEKRKDTSNIAPAVTRAIAGVMEDFLHKKNLCVIE
jgi:choline-phosphate cytidylyltransferase